MGAVFDVSKYVKFVPDFQETEVDKYFLHFEKVASNLKWPADHWALLLQGSLVGKAREVYSALSVEESPQYPLVKNAILKAYELVPEAYRQKFQNAEKQANQTTGSGAGNNEHTSAQGDLTELPGVGHSNGRGATLFVNPGS